jgi:hypothetical protein
LQQPSTPIYSKWLTHPAEEVVSDLVVVTVVVSVAATVVVVDADVVVAAVERLRYGIMYLGLWTNVDNWHRRRNGSPSPSSVVS